MYKVIVKLQRYFFKHFKGISLLQITLIFCSIGWSFDSLVMYILLAKRCLHFPLYPRSILNLGFLGSEINSLDISSLFALVI